MQNVRFLQWKHAQETTNALLKTRASALERYTYYLRLLGQTPDADRRAADDFDPRPLASSPRRTSTTPTARWSASTTCRCHCRRYGPLQLAQGSSPSNSSGAAGNGPALSQHERGRRAQHPSADRPGHRASQRASPTPSPARCTPIPSVEAHLAFWGIGVHSKLFAGSDPGRRSRRIAAEVSADHRRRYETDQAGIAVAHRRLPAPRRRLDAPGQPRRARADADRPADPRLADRRAGRLPRLPERQDAGAAGAGRAVVPAEQVHQRRLLRLDAERAVRPLLPVLPLRLRHRPPGRADHEAGADAARSSTHTQFIQFNYWDSGPSGPALRRGAAISTSSGWRWPTTTTTSASSS